jgi:ribonuclease HI
VEIPNLHTDNYGWGAVLSSHKDASGILSECGEAIHNNWKELKAVRLAVKTFFPHIAGRNVLLREDNLAVCHILAGLTSRSPAMMTELRKFLHLLDANGTNVKARYIRSAHVSADRLNMHLDSED